MDQRAEILKKIMETKGMKVSDIVKASGLPYSTVKAILERGAEKAGYVNVCKICNALGISADDLEKMLTDINYSPTIAAHFDGDEYTEEELDKIKEFAAFVKSTRKNEDKRATQKAAAPAPAADAPITFPDHLTVNAAHARNDVEATDEMQQHDEDIMDDENF